MNELWVVVCGPRRVLYASRPTREEAERVAREQKTLAEKFGKPVRVERRVAAIRPEPS